MLKLSSLKIDPEFSAQILPLSFEELQQLEQNIIAEGRLLNPIITWNGYILDGHTRYRILKKHGFIKFEVEEIQFANKYEALAWICKNQLGRRNLSPERKKFLLGKEYESTKLAVGGQPGNCYKVNISQNAAAPMVSAILTKTSRVKTATNGKVFPRKRRQ